MTQDRGRSRSYRINFLQDMAEINFGLRAWILLREGPSPRTSIFDPKMGHGKSGSQDHLARFKVCFWPRPSRLRYGQRVCSTQAFVVDLENVANPGGQGMRVAFFEIEPWEEKYLRSRMAAMGLDGKIHPCFYPDRLTLAHASALADVEAVSIFIYSRVRDDLLQALPRLKLVLTRSTGYDHIDLEACRRHNITVCHVPRYGETTVAEHTFALILALSRKVHKAYLQAQRSDFSIEGLRGFDLYGKTLGVIGTGSIGLHVIRIARGFGMRVLAYDIRPNPLFADVLGFSYTDLDVLLRESDIVSLHIPLTPQTRHLINREAFRKMKRGALLINTGRGALVDTDALLQALEEGILGGAGLDVIEGEEFVKEERALLTSPSASEAWRHVVQARLLLRREDVVFTPHIAFNSWEALQRILDTTMMNLKHFLEGMPINTV
jgi:D-lactate dehydrogenase